VKERKATAQKQNLVIPSAVVRLTMLALRVCSP
jgi:hypothetical protein